MNITQAIKQLERSERGQLTCKLLLDFLQSDTIQGLDSANYMAVAEIMWSFMFRDRDESNAVLRSLQGVVDRNRWVKVQTKSGPTSH